MTKLMSRREALVTIGNSALLAACGGGGGGGGGSPPADSKLSAVIASMNQQHEAYPHGVPASYDWRNGPVVTMGCYPNSDHLPSWATAQQKSFTGPWYQVTSWFVVHRAADGSGADLNRSSNTGVLVGAMSFWMLSRSTMRWTTIYQSRIPVWCTAHQEDGVGPISPISPIKATKTDGILCLSPIGYCSHGGQDRVSIPLATGDIAAIVGTVDHKLDLINSNLTDDRDQARFIVQCGADYYPRAGLTIADLGGYAPAAASGRYLYARNEWRTSTLFAIADDISESTILAAGWPAD